MSSDHLEAKEQQESPAKQESPPKKIFSDYALAKMMDLFENHEHEVGRKLKKSEPEKYKEYQSTDCITYVLNVLSYAFKQLKDDKAADRTWQLGKHGTELAQYLVKKHGWKGIYVNPDAKHPLDADEEHTYTSIIAIKKKKYYDIPLEYAVQNYSVTSDGHPFFQKLSKTAPVSEQNEADIASLEQVGFGFGISRGGKHTWLFSQGKVYEVHWDAIGVELYGARPLRVFPWLSNLIVIPPEQIKHLADSTKIK
ncbi:MAG: hypothetical protein D3923_11660 [Candidatus Electrothrix sp. AR3]|nr:hypothetical protein [Candidatus Electrothrix sp. AR3]